MNHDFNERAGELFGNDVKSMLEAGNTFAGRYMDDMSSLPNPSALLSLGKDGAWEEINKVAEKRKMYGMYSDKFLAYAKDPTKYDNYKYTQGV